MCAAPCTHTFLLTCLCTHSCVPGHTPVCMQVCFCVHSGLNTAAPMSLFLCMCVHVCMCVGHPASCSVVKPLTPPHAVKGIPVIQGLGLDSPGKHFLLKEWRMFPFMVAPGPFCSCLASTRRYILACSGVVTKHARLQPQLGRHSWADHRGRAEPGMTEMLAPASGATLLLGRKGG